ncbi:hypothetical protein EVJ58_g1963 [Rhodofomes roseus]|uniref:Uncharacterized protein n=1 Tax=Rhodofomes roseus TaxID=34475 RepID=A0A4Y9YTH3_9APHY|nr:hypothetical protein EVJ58_g1963 [Rhodofomes roseus]
MGRRAKYFTVAEKHEAKRIQQAKYKANRGKAERRVQNCVENPASHGNPPSPPFPTTIKGIPAGILSYARRSFRILPGPSLDVPDLCLYTRPYKLVIPVSYFTPFSEYDELFTDIAYVLDETAQAFNAQQYLLLKEKGNERCALFKSRGREVLAQRLDEELAQRLQSWEGDTGSKDIPAQAGVVQEVGVEWAARIICCLALELQLVKSGSSVYGQALRAKSLPWQCLYSSSST